MPRLTDEQLDALLGEHFGRMLASQEGRAFRHFTARTGSWRLPRIVAWSAGLVAGAAAACIAIILTQGQLVRWVRNDRDIGATSQPSTGMVPPAVAAAGAPLRREQTVAWDTLDEGSMIGADGQPLRQLRQVELQRVRLLDAQGRVVFETVIPRQRVMYIDARTY